MRFHVRFPGPRCHRFSLANLFALLMCVLFATTSAHADDAEATSQWLEKVRDHRLEFHNRVKYGMRQNVLQQDPDQIKTKWQTINSESRTNVAPEVLAYFKALETYETTVQLHAQQNRYALAWLFVRMYAESEDVGGKPAQQVFDALPDDLDEKQDIGKIAKQLFDQKVDLDQIRRWVHQNERTMRTQLSKQFPDHARQMFKSIDVFRDRVAVAKAEIAWLKKHRQDVLDRILIESQRRIAAARARLAPIATKDNLAVIAKYPSADARMFEYHRNMAGTYEDMELPQLAAPHHEQMAEAGWAAHANAYTRMAKDLHEQGDWSGALYALQQSTLKMLKPGGFGPKREHAVVFPQNTTVLDAMRELAGDKLGYIGRIKTAGNIVGLDVAERADRLVVLGRSTLTTYDLKTGKRDKLIVEANPTGPYDSLAVSGDGRYAYVMTGTMKIIRADLVAGTFDNKFVLPVTNRLVKMDVNANGSQLAVLIFSKATVYDTRTRKPIGTVTNRRASAAHAVRFTPDGRRLILGGLQGYASVYDVRTGKLWHEYLCGQGKGVQVYAFDMADNGAMAIGGVGAAHVYRSKAPKPSFSVDLTSHSGLSGYAAQVRSIALINRGKHVVTEQGVWDVATGENLATYATGQNSHSHQVTQASPRMIYARGSEAIIFPVLTGAGFQVAGDPAPKDNGNGNAKPNNQPHGNGKEPVSEDKDEADAKDDLAVAKLVMGANPKRARELLEALIAKYPNTQSAAEAKKLLEK